MYNPEEQDEACYKVIVAIKLYKEHSNTKHPNIKCEMRIQDKVKSVTLPFTEGQFFDLGALGEYIDLKFSIQGEEIGNLSIPIQDTNKAESELSEEIQFPYTYQGFELKFMATFYAIILNKTQFQKQDQQIQEEKIAEKAVKKAVEKNPEEKKREVKFNDQGKTNKPQKTRKVQRQKTGGQPLKSQVNPQEQQMLQEQIEKSVKTAMDEMKKAERISSKDLDYSPNRRTLERTATIMQQAEDPEGALISESVQIMRQSTVPDPEGRSSMSPGRKAGRTQTFVIEDQQDMSPQRQSTKMRQSTTHKHTDHYDHNCHEELTCLYYIDQANQTDQYKIQNDYLKKVFKKQQKSVLQVIYFLDRKLKSLSQTEEYGDQFRRDLEAQERVTNDLLNKLKELQLQNKELKDQLNSQLKDAYNDKHLHKNNAQIAEGIADKATQQIKSLQNELNQQKLKNKDLENQLNDQARMAQAHKEMEQNLIEAEQREQQSLDAFKDRLKQLDELLDYNNRQKQISDDKLAQALQDCVQNQNQMEKYLIELEEERDQTDKLKAALQISKQREGNSKVLQDQIGQLQAELCEKLKAKQSVDLSNEQLKKQIHELNKQLVEKDKMQNEKIKDLRKQIQSLNNQQQGLNEQMAEKTKTNMQLKSDLKTLQLKANLVNDLQKQLEEEKERTSQFYKLSKQLQIAIGEQVQAMKELNKHNQELQRRYNELNDELAECQGYAQNLKRLIVEMQEKQLVYVPFHNDPIDRALADFVNSFYNPKILNGLFIRESEGVYQFGTKKLYVKSILKKQIYLILLLVEQEKIFIRTGGGFIGIEQFLDMYTPQELEKMKRLSPQVIKKKNDEVVSTTKNLKLVNSIIQEHTSPLKVKSLGPVFSK